MLTIFLILSTIWFARYDAATYNMKNLYASSSPITPTTGNQLGTIDRYDRMTFSMDITINSFPNDWSNIFHFGNNNQERFPGIWLQNNVRGFHICMGTDQSWNDCNNVQVDGNIQTNTKYSLLIEKHQTSYTISVNNVQKVEDTTNVGHNLFSNRAIYAGDPWYPPADVLIENLKIQIPASLCCSYSAIYPFAIVGSIFEYSGELHDRPYWKDTNADRYISWSPSVNQWTWSPSLESSTGYSSSYGEVDSLNGAKWDAPMLISSTICGTSADPNPSQQNALPIFISYLAIFIIVAVIIMTVINIYGYFRTRDNQYLSVNK